MNKDESQRLFSGKLVSMTLVPGRGRPYRHADHRVKRVKPPVAGSGRHP
jgi:hypothetical protein